MSPITEEKVREIIREEMSGMLGYVFSKHLQLLDGRNIVVGKTTGTKIGTEDTQKISFYGATPVIRASHIANPSGGITTDTEARTAINSILTAIENFGIIKTS